MRSSSRFLTATLSLLLSACAWFPVLLPVPDRAARGDPIPIDGVTLAADAMSVEIEFTGGAEFDADNPCSVAYEGTVAVVEDELEVAIFPLDHPKQLEEGTACTLIGFTRTLSLPLSMPFDGIVVRNITGQVFLLGPPPTLAEMHGLPDGWKLVGEGGISEGDTPRWQRVWSPHDDPQSIGEQAYLRLVHAFGGHVDDRSGDREPSVDVNGRPASLSVYEPTGQMLLVWSIGADELALHGNLAEFTQDEFLAIAESVTIPAP